MDPITMTALAGAAVWMLINSGNGGRPPGAAGVLRG